MGNRKSNVRIVLWGGLGAVLLGGLVYAFMPQAVLVDLGNVVRAPLRVSIEEEGQTRVRDIFTLSAPIGGRALRIDLKVGDLVIADKTLIAEIEPIDPSLLDVRTEAQAKSQLSAAKAAHALAAADVDRAQAEFDFAAEELNRAQELFALETISQRERDDTERLYRTRKASLATAKAALQVRKFEEENARSMLLSPSEARERRVHCDCIPLLAPVNGSVLRVLHQSESVVAAGQPLVEIGDPTDLEIVTDLLSSDAVKVEAGQTVYLRHWGGEHMLTGVVRKVEPYGFTKVSALGVEEQRVNVIIDMKGDSATWSRLGHGFHVEAQIVLWEEDDVLQVPETALFRDGNVWAVFVLNSDGRAEMQQVETGRRNGLFVQILQGVDVGQQVVLNPSERIHHGALIAGRDM